MGILSLLATLIRGTAHDGADKVVSPHLIRVLDQQIRDAAYDLKNARHAVAVAAVAVRDEHRALATTRERILELEHRTVAAMAAGDDRMATEGAGEIARCEASIDRTSATLARASERLQAHEKLVDQSQSRLDALISGRKEASAAAAVLAVSRRAGKGAGGTGALAAAESTLKRIVDSTERGQSVNDALAYQEERTDVVARLAAAGHGAPTVPTANSVLERLRSRAAIVSDQS
jgi:phage shock protein A